MQHVLAVVVVAAGGGPQVCDKMLFDPAATMGALVHTRELREKMYDVREAKAGQVVMMNNHPERVVAIGKLDVCVRCAKTSKVMRMTLADVLYVPTSTYFILGWSAYARSLRMQRRMDKRVKAVLWEKICSIPLADGSLVWAKLERGLFFLQVVADNEAVCTVEEKTVNQSAQVHASRDNEGAIVKDEAVLGNFESVGELGNKDDVQPLPASLSNDAARATSLAMDLAIKRVARLHRCLNHVALSALQELIKAGEFNSRAWFADKMVRDAALRLTDAECGCKHCKMAMLRKKHPKKSGAPEPFDGQWTMDQAGPNPRSKAGNRNKSVVMAPNYKGVFAHFSRKKNSGRDALMVHRRRWERMTGEKMKVLRTDGGKEMMSERFTRYLNKHGITHSKTAPGSSAGAAESYIGHIQDRGLANLNQAVDLSAALYWDEAENAAVHSLNIMPIKALGGKSMYENRTGRKPDYSKERPFGAIAIFRMTGKVPRVQNPGVKGYYLGPAAHGDAGKRFLRLDNGAIVHSNSYWIDPDCFSWKEPAAACAQRDFEKEAELDERTATGLRKAKQVDIESSPEELMPQERAAELKESVVPVEDEVPEQPVVQLEQAQEMARRPVRSRKQREPPFDPSLQDLAYKLEAAARAEAAKVQRAEEAQANVAVMSGSFRERRRRKRAMRKAWKRSKEELNKVMTVVNMTTTFPLSQWRYLDQDGGATGFGNQVGGATGFVKHEGPTKVLGFVNTTWWEQNADNGSVAQSLEEAQRDVELWPYYKAALEIEEKQQKAANTYVRERVVDGKRREFPDAPVIGVKYVFERKRVDPTKSPDEFQGPQYYKKNGQVWKFKARWVARGDQQKEGTYGETYAPTPMLASLLLIISMCVGLRWDVHCLDVTGAFLLPRLRDDETIYLQPPKGDAARGLWLFRLLACIYGLRESGARWRENVKDKLSSMDFHPTKADPSVYVKYDPDDGGLVCAIGVHVDDFLVGAADKIIAEVKAHLHGCWKMTDAGRVSWFLKVKFTWSADRKTLYLSQPDYIEEIMEVAGVSASETEQLPGVPGEVLLRAEEDPNMEESELEGKELPSEVPFLKVLGMVSYVSQGFRPDITFYTGAVQRCASNPRPRHWRALLHIVRYLAGHKHYGIRYSANPEEGDPSFGRIVAYSDSDHSKDPQTRRSIGGGAIMLNGGPLSWRSVQNKHVTRSTMESELSALDMMTKDALFIRKIGMELKVDGAETIPIYEDNEATERFANGSKLTPLNKHIDIKYFAVRDDVDNGRVQVIGVSTEKNVADMFTKPLALTDFLRHRQALGIVEIPTDLR